MPTEGGDLQQWGDIGDSREVKEFRLGHKQQQPRRAVSCKVGLTNNVLDVLQSKHPNAEGFPIGLLSNTPLHSTARVPLRAPPQGLPQH